MRSRSARVDMLTRYATPGFELVENLPRRPDLSLFRVLQALTYALPYIGTGGNVEEALISFGVLHDGRRLPLHRKHHGALGSLELFHEVAGPAAERCQ